MHALSFLQIIDLAAEQECSKYVQDTSIFSVVTNSLPLESLSHFYPKLSEQNRGATAWQ